MSITAFAISDDVRIAFENDELEFNHSSYDPDTQITYFAGIMQHVYVGIQHKNGKTRIIVRKMNDTVNENNVIDKVKDDEYFTG